MKNVVFGSKMLFLTIFGLIVPAYLIDPCSKQFQIVTDFGIGDCARGTFYVESGNPAHGCFPRCEKEYLNYVDCDPRPCPAGHVCDVDPSDPDHTICHVVKDSCFKYYTGDKTTNPWMKAMFKPECLPDGTWAPKQCKGEKSNGRCFCFDPVGNRIFGQEFVEQAVNMTCACSRKRIELMKNKSRFYASLHCDSVGNYEPLQCDSGQCWCVEPMTGKITAKVVPETMMPHLPCYSEKDVGEQYLRICESEEYAQANIVNELNVHGTKHANFPHILCDADGSYGHFQTADGRTKCTWKDKSFLNYEAAIDHETVDLNCNCARDKKIYALEGMAHNLLCLSNGNYRPEQQATNGKWYCVDTDGFRKSEYFDKVPQDCKNYI